MVTILCDKMYAQLTFAAVDVIGRESGEWSTLDIADSQNALQGTVLLGLIADFGTSDSERFLETFDHLWKREARSFVLFAPEIGATPRPWQCLPPLHRGAFEQAFVLCGAADQDALKDAISTAGARPVLPEWVVSRLRETIEARQLQSRVRSFSHGAESDLTNQFLAPARLLLLAHTVPDLPAELTKGWRTVWSRFDEAVLREARDPGTRTGFGQIGQELASAADAIDKWLGNEKGTPCAAEDLERLMALLTECRVAAGDRAAPEPRVGSKGGPVAPVGSPQSDFRVLVIDDHAEAWQPVVTALQRRLEEAEHRVLFEHSADAANVWTRGAGESKTDSAPIHFGSYHMVLLDIFLSPTTPGLAYDGREVLRTMRESWPNLPVVLWTTSRDDEVTRNASQANGVLLKKTISWGELTEAVRIWIPRGRAIGAFSLPSVFFNHVIHAPDDRELVRDFFAWGLKQLDSFHALDGKIFRFFTDHGGRHIVKLLELFEKALQPFLGAGDERVLARDPKTREFEYLALCLAVISHELGMFPMKISGNVENFAELAMSGEGYLEAVRSLHAPRGMVLLHSAVLEGTCWNDAAGQLLGQKLHEREHPENRDIKLGHLLATIVGYHARFFKSLKTDKFLRWCEDAEDRFGQLSNATNEAAGVSKRQLRSTLEALSNLLKSKPILERLRRQCALFRFVDAVDIDASRNPAPFIILDRRRNAVNNREYLKREVVKRVELEKGKVNLTSLALKPTGEMVREMLAGQRGFRSSNPDHCAVLLESPWSTAKARKLVKKLYNKLDRWLTSTWEAIMRNAKSEHSECLERLGLLVANGSGHKATEKGKQWIATITALAVAGEVVDEYSAIEESGLDREDAGIQLGCFSWADPEIWSNNAPPKVVTILCEGLELYPLRGDGSEGPNEP
jgi:CheY-like chemotaxis protein/uncharacterized protein YidB (DUF937 family)